MTSGSKGKTLEIFTDGACSGNPGEAGIGIVINCSGRTVKKISRPIGWATNNIAEYTALVFALKEALALKATDLSIYTDSELMCRQISGAYKVRDEKLRLLFDQVLRLMQDFDQVEVSHIRREQNQEADQLAVEAIEKRQTKVAAPAFNNGGEESPSSDG